MPVDDARLDRIDLRGQPQWILARGPRDAPPLLFVHGGPGAPLFPLADDIGRGAGLERHFRVLYWEQAGTGRSCAPRPPAERMTVASFVADLLALAEAVAARHDGRRPLLLGHSWGSVLGVMAAARRPDLFTGYLGVGQVALMRESERLGWEFARAAAERRRHPLARAQLRRLGPPPHTPGGMLQNRFWVSAFGGASVAGREISPPGWARRILLCPWYGPGTLLRWLRDPLHSWRRLVPELNDVDLFAAAPRLELPVAFLHGRRDHIVAGAVAERYFHALEAPAGKSWHWFEASAHLPFIEEPERFGETVRDFATGLPGAAPVGGGTAAPSATGASPLTARPPAAGA